MEGVRTIREVPPPKSPRIPSSTLNWGMGGGDSNYPQMCEGSNILSPTASPYEVSSWSLFRLYVRLIGPS